MEACLIALALQIRRVIKAWLQNLLNIERISSFLSSCQNTLPMRQSQPEVHNHTFSSLNATTLFGPSCSYPSTDMSSSHGMVSQGRAALSQNKNLFAIFHPFLHPWACVTVQGKLEIHLQSVKSRFCTCFYPWKSVCPPPHITCRHSGLCYRHKTQESFCWNRYSFLIVFVLAFLKEINPIC